MKDLLIICKKEDLPIFQRVDSTRNRIIVKTIDQLPRSKHGSLDCLPLFREYNYIVVVDFEERKIPHMDFTTMDSFKNYLSINGLCYCVYSGKELRRGINIVNHAEKIKSAQNNSLILTI
jgi:hypothetical protein